MNFLKEEKMYRVKKREIFKYFFSLGLFTIGGGYAMISFIENELCKKRKWLNEEEFLEIIAISQSLPGVLATSVSTFVGEKIGGKSGAFLATLGISLPPFLIFVILFPFLNKSFQSPALEKFFIGIQAGVLVLILNSALNLFKHSVKNKWNYVIFTVSIVALVFFKINPIWIIIFGFLSGYVNSVFEGRKL